MCPRDRLATRRPGSSNAGDETTQESCLAPAERHLSRARQIQRLTRDNSQRGTYSRASVSQAAGAAAGWPTALDPLAHEPRPVRVD
jgi:hypothetical protein